MNIHEHQAKELFRRYGVPVPNGGVAFTVEEAVGVAERLMSPVTVVKAQIHAGGRGKGGGVKLARSLDEVRAHAQALLGMTLVTPQTGPKGRVVKRLLVEEGCEIARELYVALVLDRATGKLVVMASTEGGVDIEAVAARTPEKIQRAYAPVMYGLQAYQARQLAFGLKLEGPAVNQAVALLLGISRLFVEQDASQVEINPLVVTKDNRLLALDAKINFDDNALYRRGEIAALRDPNEEDPKEAEAAQAGLSYIKLDGGIGCLVNGAGLAMATMDVIKYYGGEPANFLDVGGGANKDQVTTAFKIILSDPHVKAILVNIFGGIMRCDTIAEGVTAAVREVGLKVPLVVRLSGTKAAEGRAIVAQSGLSLISAETLDEGAKKVVALAKGGRA
ncbi:MAG: ADP-forming succinate--CoA ligase subunit beta [Myxococcales bacterium]|nr:MAG: ADP-forming succinate--CoA ligase subunit beta [Myxococcales bacterium]